MQEWDKYRQVKIRRGDLVSRIKNKKQADWIKVCDRLGIIVSTEYGNGSHAVAYKDNCPPEDRKCCISTLTYHMYAEMQSSIFKKFLAYGLESGKYNEDDIWRALGVKF